MSKFFKRKTAKYKSKKTIVDGISFPSRKEARRYQELKLLKKAGEIKDFELQPEFELQPKFKFFGRTIRPIKYIADFRVIYPDGTEIIEDTKGIETDVFKIKKKMLLYRYPEINFKVVK